MSSYLTCLNSIRELNIDLNTLEAKKALDKDFFKHAKINNIVSILYYPGQHFFPSGHIELAVEGRCYTMMQEETTLEPYSLSKKQAHALGGKLPFKQCNISVTPEHLAQINQNLCISDFLSSCAHGVSRVLGRAAHFHIPPFINYFPLLSYLYLAASHALSTRPILSEKTLKEKRIQKIESHGRATKNLANFVWVTVGICGELYIILKYLHLMKTMITSQATPLTKGAL